MQYQVDPTDQTHENGQKPLFWCFGSFKDAFFWFLNDPAWAILSPNCSEYLILSKYAIWSPSDLPNWRNRPKTEWIIQIFYASHEKFSQKSTRFFPDIRFSRGVHRKSEFSFSTLKSDHQWLHFSSKSAQSWKTLKNGCFWHCVVIIEWSGFFPENRAVSVFITNCPLTSDQKLESSYGWKYHNFWTDGHTDHFLSCGLNWSWEL